MRLKLRFLIKRRDRHALRREQHLQAQRRRRWPTIRRPWISLQLWTERWNAR